MSNPFSDAIHDVSTMKVAQELDVTDMLLGELAKRGVITPEQRDKILVRSFNVFNSYRPLPAPMSILSKRAETYLALTYFCSLHPKL